MALPLVWLADELKAEGLAVTEHTGWKTRSDPRDVYSGQLTPVGVIDHHTAGSSILTDYPDPPYWTDTRLEAVCNITIRPDGTLSTLNAGIAYDSGLGSRKVYDAVRLDKPLPPLSGLTSDMNGTLYFIDIEVQHRGDGGPIDPRQLDTLIRTNAVICRHYNWDPMTRVIGHREWAPDRKTDPKWNGTTNPMPSIRSDTKEAMEEDEMTPEEQKALNWLVNALASKGSDPPAWGSANWSRYKTQWGSTPPGPGLPVTHLQLSHIWAVLDSQIRAIAPDDADIDAVITEIIERLEFDPSDV